jgi:hypothetical protein
MKKVIFLILPFILLLPNYSIAQLRITTPDDYVRQYNNETDVIYLAQKTANGIISSNFQIKVNNDWSFKTLTNHQYIENLKKSNEIDDYGKNFLKEFRILMKTEFYFKSVGNTFMMQYIFNENGKSIVNTSIQFIKSDKLYTCTGSTIASFNDQSFNEYLKIVESVQL